MKVQRMFKSVIISDDLNTANLSITDELRLLFQNVGNEDVIALDAQTKLIKEQIVKKAALTRLLQTACDKMKEKNEEGVTLSVSSTFLPFIDEVVDPIDGMGRFYHFEVLRNNDIPPEVKYYFIVRIEKKG